MGLLFNKLYKYINGFTPASLFAAGEQGAWYDPSDLTSLFQESVGTTPMSAVGTVADQPVGLMKDKSGRGNHAFQATTTNRPLLSARVNLLLATATLSTQSVTSQATSYTLAFTGTGTVTLSGTATGTLSAGSNTFTATAGTLTLTVSGSVTLADLRPTNAGALLPPYQRVNTDSDYDAVGFPLYLKFNGTSSFLSNPAHPFSYTDPITAIFGFSHNGAFNTYETLFSAGATTNALTNLQKCMAFQLSSDIAASPTPNFCTDIWAPSGVKTNTALGNLTKYVGSFSITNWSTHKISGTTSNINGVAKTISSYGTLASIGLNSGTMNIGVFDPFALSTSFYSGALYGIIIRCAQSDTASVTQTETYMATKTGITF